MSDRITCTESAQIDKTLLENPYIGLHCFVVRSDVRIVNHRQLAKNLKIIIIDYGFRLFSVTSYCSYARPAESGLMR